MWGWASPPLRLQVAAGGTRGAALIGLGSVSHHHQSITSLQQHQQSRMGEMVVDRAPSPARLSHTSEKHPRGLLAELAALRRHRELCDVVLNVGNRKIFCHRVILSACSPYFRFVYYFFF